jgi:hypothetical protein
VSLRAGSSPTLTERPCPTHDRIRSRGVPKMMVLRYALLNTVEHLAPKVSRGNSGQAHLHFNS